MKTSTSESFQSPQQHPSFRDLWARKVCSFSRFWLIVFTLVTLATTAQANYIIGIKDCNCTNLTIQLSQFPQGALVVQLGFVTLSGTFNYAKQTFTATRPVGLTPGTYLLSIRRNNLLQASKNIVLCDCVPCDCPPGPPGPVGPKGATGPQGPQGIKGDKGATGLKGNTGPMGSIGLTGLTGPIGLSGTNGLDGINGTNGLPGLPGLNGTNGLSGINGTNGLPGLNGTNGLNGINGTNGLNGINGTNGVNGINGTNGLTTEFGYIFNLTAQVVALEAAVIFSDNGIGTAGILHGPETSDIVLVKAGIYKVGFSASGTEPNQFALFINGVVVPGTAYGSGAGTQQNNGQAILSVAAGDVLTLRNHTSAAAVTLAASPPIGGSALAVNASILIQKLD